MLGAPLILVSYVYEVRPVNCSNLNEPDGSAVLIWFAPALKQLGSAVVFRVRLGAMQVVAWNELHTVARRRYFLESDQDGISPHMQWCREARLRIGASTTR